MRFWDFGRWRFRLECSAESSTEGSKGEVALVELGLEGVAGEVVELPGSGCADGVCWIVIGGAGVAHDEGVLGD